MISIEPYEHVHGIRFGEPSSAVVTQLGEPRSRRISRNGEDELCYPEIIWRFRDDQMVECTLTMKSPVLVRGQVVASFREWLPTADREAVTKRGFLVSQAFGIAADLDDERYEYVSIFERGRWDDLS
jgi:hypothetical protein